MRGLDERTGSLFSYVDLEDRVPAKHPLRVIQRIVNDVLLRSMASSQRSVRKAAAPRFRRSAYCKPCCCRRGTQSARRGS
jgi:hypothetical protein